MNNDHLEFIEHLESIRQAFRPSTYRFMIAEALVHFFFTKTKSPSEIRNHTNEVLKKIDIEGISLGYVRNIVEK